MRRKLIFRKKVHPTQMELGIDRTPEPDRNFAKGGRSFYFFDFDDNIAFLSTPIYLFHKHTGREVRLSSREYATHSANVGRRGAYRDYHCIFDDESGSFRCFRDRDLGMLERILGRRQAFVEDLAAALGVPDVNWKGPSWSCFYHTVFNGRPLSLITARGHHPTTIRQGISLMVEQGVLPHEPNYLSLFPVSHPPTRERLALVNGADQNSVPQLKRAAIRASFYQAIETYGHNPYHRFGMSDDDPANIQLIIEEMAKLKAEHPEICFFVIDTHQGKFVKREVFKDHTEDQLLDENTQLSLFRDQNK